MKTKPKAVGQLVRMKDIFFEWILKSVLNIHIVHFIRAVNYGICYQKRFNSQILLPYLKQLLNRDLNHLTKSLLSNNAMTYCLCECEIYCYI